jgi:hypothetical protein
MKTRQFFALLRFSALINPFIWIFPLAFGFPALMMSQVNLPGAESLESLLPVQNIFFVAIIGVSVLAPDMMQTRFSRNAGSWSGSEFLLTRAIDRPCLYRARAALVFALALVLPVFLIARSINAPDLTVYGNSKQLQSACLDAVAGAKSVPDPTNHRATLLFLPRGHVLVSEWQLWYVLMALLFVQLVIPAIAPFKYGLFIFYAVFGCGTLAPLYWRLHQIGHHGQSQSPEESIFFFFTSHQVPFWLGTALAWIGCQLVCERFFTRQEF